MHILEKITVRATMDQNICIIFFVTVSIQARVSFKDLQYIILKTGIGSYVNGG